VASRVTLAWYVEGFLPQVGHDDVTSTAVNHKSLATAVAVVGEGRAVRSGAQIPMITELGQLTAYSLSCYLSVGDETSIQLLPVIHNQLINRNTLNVRQISLNSV